MVVPRLIEVELRVRDVQRSLHFYRDLLGLTFGELHTHPGGEGLHAHAEWGSWKDSSDEAPDDFLMLGIYPADPGGESSASLSFGVDSVDALHDDLVRDRIEVVHEPHDRPWGRSATYVDPDGNWISLVE